MNHNRRRQQLQQRHVDSKQITLCQRQCRHRAAEFLNGKDPPTYCIEALVFVSGFGVQEYTAPCISELQSKAGSQHVSNVTVGIDAILLPGVPRNGFSDPSLLPLFIALRRRQSRGPVEIPAIINSTTKCLSDIRSKRLESQACESQSQKRREPLPG